MTTTLGADEANAELRQHAIETLRLKRKFVKDALGYATVNGALWVIWALFDRSVDGLMPWPAYVSVIWGFFLATDAWKAYASWPRSLHHPISETEIEREMRRSR